MRPSFDMLKKILALSMVASLCLTAPGFEFYAVAANVVSAPGAQTGASVAVPVVPVALPGETAIQSGRWTAETLRGNGSLILRLPDNRTEAGRIPEAALRSQEAGNGILRTGPAQGLKDSVGALPSLPSGRTVRPLEAVHAGRSVAETKQAMEVLTLATGEPIQDPQAGTAVRKTLLGHLNRPSLVEQLPPQAGIEEVHQASDGDFKRLQGLDDAGRAAGNLPVVRPEDPAKSVPIAAAGQGARGTAIVAPLAAAREAASNKEGRTYGGKSATASSAVKAWESEVALNAYRFIETSESAASRPSLQVPSRLRDVPASLGGGPVAGGQRGAASRVDGAEKSAVQKGAAVPADGRSSKEADRSTDSPRQYRSIQFPALVSAITAAGLGLFKLVENAAGWFSPVASLSAVQPHQLWYFLLNSAGGLAMTAVGFFAAWTALEAVFYGLMTRIGRSAGPREFAAFLSKDAKERPGLYQGLLGVRPGTGILKGAFDKELRPFGVFGFTLPQAIYIRPELVRIPWLFRIVLRHELHHFRQHLGRAPPPTARPFRQFANSILAEFAAHLIEFLPSGNRFPQAFLLERVLHQAQLSLRLSSPYDVLVVGREAGSIAASDFVTLSDGKARIHTLKSDDVKVLNEKAEGALDEASNQKRFRSILFNDPGTWLPEGEDFQALEMAFRRMEQIYRERVSELRQKPQGFEQRPAKPMRLWDQVISPRVSGLGVIRLMDRLYGSLQDKGIVLMPFAPGDASLGTLETIFRHWSSKDNGYFRTVRVDLGEGGHVLVAEKTEPRVRVWIKPVNDSLVAESIDNVYRDPVKKQAAEQILEHLGLDRWLPIFRSIGLEIVHIQGADVGDTRIYVSLPRDKVSVIQGLVEEGKATLIRSDESFRPLSFDAGLDADVQNGLFESVPRQKGPQAWKIAGKGQGMSVYVVDTGVWKEHPDFGGRVESKDFVDEGPEDWHGHGTQTIGDVLAGGDRIRGIAPEAQGFMGKVFPRGAGASDGDIQAAWGDAQKRGADVISMSLGSPGTPDSSLAKAASELTRRKNSKGEYPIVVASMGNSGPDDETGGQPGVGDEVIAVAAATKGETDGIVDIALYSSAGWGFSQMDRRPVLKPEITAIGGNVNTPDERGDVYKHGLTSPRSKDAEPSPSDEADGLHTRAAGTSMSGPQVAGAAALVKAALLQAAKGDAEALGFAKENINFVVKMLLMVSAEDMRIPVQKQGAGLLDVEAAVKAALSNFGRSAGNEKPWDWILRARGVVDATKRVYDKANAATDSGFMARVLQTPYAEVFRGMFASDKARGDAWNKALAEESPSLQKALQDPVWIVRFYAAFAFIGLKDSGALPALTEAALKDPDPRVRQIALQAIAETRSKSGDEALLKALEDAKPEVRAYAAVALARHGRKEGTKALLELAGHAGKPVRYTALWALGQVGRAVDVSVTERLAGAIANTAERDTNRHVSIASLARLIAAGNAAAFTPKVFEALLDGAGPKEMIVTRSVSRFFQKAASDRALQRVMAEDPVKKVLVSFIEKYQSHASRRGGLGDLVRLLARVTGTQTGGLPTTDPSSQGVPGVDENLGPIHLIVEVPEGRGRIARTVLAGQSGHLDRPLVPGATRRVLAAQSNAAGSQDTSAEALKQALTSVQFPMQSVAFYGGRVRSVMKEGFIAVELPAYSADAFAQEMAMKGFLVQRANPRFLFLKDTGPLSGLPEVREKLGITGKGTVTLVIDEGLDTENPAFKGKILGVVNTSGEGAASDVTDESVGHGTHTGNIAAGSQRPDGNPNIGRAPDSFIIAAKVLGRSGGSEATVMEGVSGALQILDDANAKLAAYWKAKDAGQAPSLPEGEALQKAIGMGIRQLVATMNLSLGGPGDKESEMNLQLRKIHLANRAMISVAAGNDGPGEGTANRTSPGNEWSVKTVGAVSKKAEPEFYSSEGTDDDPIVKIAHYGGDVAFDNACPFIPGGIISALAAKAAEEAARCIVPHNGKPTDQAMSGTSMASPHSAGDDALVLEMVLKSFSAEEIAKTQGLGLWLDQVAYDCARKIEGAKASKVGAGLRDVKRELEVLSERLKDKGRVARESLELYKKAQERDRREASQRWSLIESARTGQINLWTAVWHAVVRPIGRLLFKLASVFAAGRQGAASFPHGSGPLKK